MASKQEKEKEAPVGMGSCFFLVGHKKINDFKEKATRNSSLSPPRANKNKKENSFKKNLPKTVSVGMG